MSLAFAFLLPSRGGFAHHVYRTDGEGDGLRRVTAQRAIGRPAFSPGGTYLVFPGPVTDDSDGRYALYTVQTDGGSLRRITDSRLADADPAWSPDGKRIAFVRQVTGAMDPTTTRLYTMPAGGGTPSQITSTPGARDPAWSPDSKQLAFTAGGVLYVVPAAGGALRQLAGAGARFPAWSPDGRSIAYVQQMSKDRSRLVTVAAGGSSATLRADHGGQVEDPHWDGDSETLHYVVYSGQGYEGRRDTAIWRSRPGSAAVPVARFTSSICRLGHQPDPPPGLIQSLLAEVTQRTVSLSWRNPDDRDFAAAEVRMVAGSVPVTSPTAGTLVYAGRTPATLVTSGINAASTYSFTVFARDANGSYSGPVSTTVTTPPPRAPDAPAHVEAVPGTRAARVSWSAPLNDGGRVITRYTVNVTGRPAVDVGPAERSIVVSPLSASSAHVVQVVAHNELGTSPPGITDVTPDTGAVAGTYTALAPARLFDTRSTSGPMTSTTDVVVPVAGSVGVPPSGALSVAMSVTVTAPTAAGHLKVYPANQSEPNVSTLNFLAGQTVANHDVVRLGGGSIALALAAGSAHVIADVAGFYAEASGPPGGRLNSLAPTRLLDTRLTRTPIAGGTSRTLQVTGVGGVPSSGVASAVIVLTAVQAPRNTHLTVYPAGGATPTTSVSNPAAGDTVAVLVTTKLSANGALAIFNSAGAQHVVVDVLGYHTADSGQPGELYVPLAPARAFDTRLGTGVRAGRLGPEEVLTVPLRGLAGVPASARTVLVNLTATQPTSSTYLTVWPSDRLASRTSVLNVAAGRTVANLVLAKLGPTGAVRVRNAFGSVHVIGDVRGYFATTFDA